MAFHPNVGLADERVRFMSAGAGYQLFLSPSEAVFTLPAPAASPASRSNTTIGAGDEPGRTALGLRWVGANPNAQAASLEELPGKVNFLVGDDRAKWRTDIPTYARVQFEDVWPGIDVVYYGNQNRLEYDLVVAPGADPSAIELAVTGASRIERDARGDLVFTTAGREIRQQRPVVYQEVEGRRQAVTADYLVAADGLVSFDVGPYDRSAPLIIDPVLTFSTYLGGNAFDGGFAVVDLGGHLFVAGTTNSTDFPTEAPDSEAPYQIAIGGAPTAASDGFITKLSPSGSAIIYSTYLGGAAEDAPFGIAVDPDGNVVVAGVTRSGDFPTQSPIQGTLNGDHDLFVTKLNATGSGLIYSTYIGGSGDESGFNASIPSAWGALSLDATGRACVTSRTNSTDFPTTPNAFSAALQGVVDACVVVLDPAGTTIEYGTYFGGGNNDGGLGVHIDGAGDIYLAGFTTSPDLPTAPATPFQGSLSVNPDFFGNQDYFVAKLRVTGSGTGLVYSTYLGGSRAEFIVGTTGPTLAVDQAGRAILRGATNSSDYPVVNAAQPTAAGGLEAYVTMLDPTGTALVFSTYLGGSGADAATGVAVDAVGNVYVSGRTPSADFPTVNPVPPGVYNGGIFDAFVAMYSPSGSLEFSTFLGASGYDYASAVAASEGRIYLVGRTNSTDFPLVNAIQGDQPDFDAFVAEISSTGNIAGVVRADCPAPGTPLQGVTVDAFAVGSGTLLGTGVTDAVGQYSIPNLAAVDYTISVLTPLGYIAGTDIPTTVSEGQTSVVDFSLTCVSAAGNVRSKGFWKHQVGVATGKRGNAHIDAATLCSHLDLIEVHFNENALNQVVVYEPPPSATCGMKLLIAKDLLNLPGSAAMIDRARAQLLALLLNVAANFAALQDVISADGATVSQAITFCDNLIDDPAGNHELAKDIADTINNGGEVAAGVIPLSTPSIAYRLHPAGPSDADELAFQVTPNPTKGARTFRFVINGPGPVSLTIFDIAGRRVANVYQGTLGAGHHALRWEARGRDGGSLHKGTYFARLTTASASRTLKLVQTQR